MEVDPAEDPSRNQPDRDNGRSSPSGEGAPNPFPLPGVFAFAAEPHAAALVGLTSDQTPQYRQSHNTPPPPSTPLENGNQLYSTSEPPPRHRKGEPMRGLRCKWSQYMIPDHSPQESLDELEKEILVQRVFLRRCKRRTLRICSLRRRSNASRRPLLMSSTKTSSTG